MDKITVIGGGVAGIGATLELAKRGYQVRLIERDTLGSGSSGRNPGRMGHGFHYADIPTALAYLNASIQVQRAYPGFMLKEDEPSSPLARGRYFIMKDSKPGKEEVLASYKAIAEEYARLVALDSRNQVFGPPADFYRILPREAFQNDVNSDLVDVGIETNEHLFDWKKFMVHARGLITQNPSIELLEHTTVEKLERNSNGKTRFTVSTKQQGQNNTFTTNYIVNSTWDKIAEFNQQLGFSLAENERTNRLKVLLRVKLPEALVNKNSMFFCMGPHCMMSNMGDGTAMMTYARVTNLETCSGLSLSANAERLLREGPTAAEMAAISKEILEGVTHYIPAMKDAEILDVKIGVVQTKGKLTLEDLQNPQHGFNRRDDHCVSAKQIGLIANPCMKLFYFTENGKLVVDIIDQQLTNDAVINAVIESIIINTAREKLPFTANDEQKFRAQLECGDPSKLVKANIEQLMQLYLCQARAKLGLENLSMLRQERNDQGTCEVIGNTPVCI